MSNILKILFLCSDPSDLVRMRLGKEISEIEAKIRSSRYRDRFQIISQFALKEDDIRWALLAHEPDVLHFSGHGHPTQGIIVEDANGKANYLHPERLRKILATLPGNLRIVFLNACYSSYMAEAISQTVEITIGMSDKILDSSAISFSANFYLALGFNKVVKTCFDTGVTALVGSETPQDLIPQLFTRPGVDASQIRLLSISSDQQPPTITSQPKSEGATVQLDLIVLPANAAKAKAWRYATDATDQNGKFFITLDERRDRLPLDETWKQLGLYTGGHAAGLANPSRETAADVFLFLRENLIECLHDEETLENIVNHAVDSTLGGNLYIGWDQKTTFPNLYQKKFYRDIERWFEVILASGAADLIELPANMRLEQPGDYKHLRKLAQRSESRRRRLRKLVTHNDWSVVLRPEALALKKFLTRFVEEDLLWDEERNLAVFYDQKPRQGDGWSTLMEDSRNLERNGNWFISALSRGNTKDRDLEELWLNESQKKSPPNFHGVFEFDGTFQWLYAFLRLKLAVRLTEVTSPSVAGKVLI